MTDAEPSVETQELSETALGLIGSYRMGTALNTRDLFAKNPADAPSAELVLVPAGDTRDGIHLGGHSGTGGTTPTL